MSRNLVETVMGAMVLAIALLFTYFVYTTADIKAAPGYEIGAVFNEVGGLAAGSDVRINGIKVGTVNDRHLDPETYAAVVMMTVGRDIKLPVDTVAIIASDGPLGGKYLELRPGTDAELIPPGGLVRETRSYRSLEDQVGEIIFLATNKPEQKTAP
jgi:ABC-type transport system involved in resistance to organic solvents, periplasmic component